MDISLKLGTYNFLKNQLTSADTLLKPLFDNSGDHLLIKELATSGDYKSVAGQLDLSKDLLLLVYIKLNNEQISIFQDKINYKLSELAVDNNEPAVFRNKENFREFLLINSFQAEKQVQKFKQLASSQLKDGLQKSSQEPLGFFTKAYKTEF
ncbi:hypothetical protein [Companilactobacillus versmoldensis]|uniref:Uncharacterized protein n=1 Tax=Companilactobacillus versmoldensis DSM 14857 = KCTC 3814 TaxID=1423815 RepID=A0A0R1SBF2_9LACO|nr:hypothetical protein [Companilactobacillus versmoldensis]KRL66268.1 hypothetical protein FC27_GL000729 [Companilactobacillus versmoldensis DSM 14857 = KCTC 3814]